jgi:hypothetical protein
MIASDLPPRKRRLVRGIEINTRFDLMTTPLNKRRTHRRKSLMLPPPELL